MNRRKTDPPQGILKSGVSDANRYRYIRYRPSSDLASYVEHFWVVEWDLRGQRPESAETLPHPSVHMIFESGGRSHIRGPSRAKFSRLIENRGSIFAVKFTPAGFRPFSREPVRTLADRAIPIRDVFGAGGDALDRAVVSGRSDASRIALIERFLRERDPGKDENVSRISAIVYSAANDRSILTVQDLVDRFAQTTIRTLQRLFATYVGVGPKWVIQRYRLHEAAAQLAAIDSINHASLASELGYSDQAHFVRDFKRVVGMTPAAYAKCIRA